MSDHRRSGAVLCERRAEFGGGLESPALARRLLRDALVTVGRDAWLDTGELAVSEVVTNAALHAHSRIDLTIEVFDDVVCVQVRDFNPAPPLQRSYDDEATTGRGMALVATLAVDCGVEMLGEDGKVVWFCVGDEPDRTEDDVLAAWELDDWDAAPTPDRQLVTLRGMPVTLWFSARQHHDAILRELALYAATRRDECNPDLAAADCARSTISGSLVAFLQDEASRGVRHAVAPTIDGAAPTQAEVVDLELAVPVDSARLFIALQDVLDSAERLAIEGHLLASPALPEVVAVRDWACEQIVAQLAGVPASPWGGVAQRRFETEVRSRAHTAPSVWDASLITEATTCAAAADDANRLVAVSEPLAELVGWTVDELVGRRIISLIPPRFREAHVAGFTRLLTTGEAHVLGVELDVLFLCRDGSERRCRMVLEEQSTALGAVYVAWIDPILDA